MEATSEQVHAAVRASVAIGQAIRELGSVPAGHLYAQLCGKLTLSQFDGLIGMLVRGGLVRRDASHLLTWIG